MLSAGARHTAGHNLAALGYKTAQARYVLIIYALNLIHAELAGLSSGPARAAGLSNILLGHINLPPY